MNHSLRAKKHLGQHFLRDKRIVARIIALLDVNDGDRVIEIGPGPGTLTIPLNRDGVSITVIETDGDMVDHLKKHPFSPAIDIIHADFLALNVHDLIGQTTKIVSNLPYKTSVPITSRLLEATPFIELMVMMYQKEVADRIRAPSGTKAYGPISVLCQLWYDISVAIKAPPSAFWPPPKVHSRVLSFQRRPAWSLPPREAKALHGLLNFAFQNRRKMLGTVLKKGANITPWSRSELARAFAACGFDAKARPENLDPEAYALWFQHLRATSGKKPSS